MGGGAGVETGGVGRGCSLPFKIFRRGMGNLSKGQGGHITLSSSFARKKKGGEGNMR